MKGSLPASCQCQLAQVRGHESIQHSPVAAIRSMLIALMIIVTFTTTTLQVTAFEDSQIRFVKGEVKPIDNRAVMGMRGKHVHSIAVNVKNCSASILEQCWKNGLRTTYRKYPLDRCCSGDLGPLGLIIRCCGVTDVNPSAVFSEQY